MYEAIDRWLIGRADQVGDWLQSERGWSAPAIILAAIRISDGLLILLSAIPLSYSLQLGVICALFGLMVASSSLYEIRELRRDIAAGWGPDLAEKYEFRAMFWRGSAGMLRVVPFAAALVVAIFAIAMAPAEPRCLFLLAMTGLLLDVTARSCARSILPQTPGRAQRRHALNPV